MAHHLDPGSIEQTATRLGKNTRLVGVLRFTSSARISGTYEGEIEAEGFLYIEDGANVQANVRARNIVVGGKVTGNLEAIGEVEMLPGCVVYGNVRAARIRIADGVVFEGRCEMLRNSDGIDIFSLPLEQLRKQATPIIAVDDIASRT